MNHDVTGSEVEQLIHGEPLVKSKMNGYHLGYLSLEKKNKGESFFKGIFGSFFSFINAATSN